MCNKAAIMARLAREENEALKTCIAALDAELGGTSRAALIRRLDPAYPSGKTLLEGDGKASIIGLTCVRPTEGVSPIPPPPWSRPRLRSLTGELYRLRRLR